MSGSAQGACGLYSRLYVYLLHMVETYAKHQVGLIILDHEPHSEIQSQKAYVKSIKWVIAQNHDPT